MTRRSHWTLVAIAGLLALCFVAGVAPAQAHWADQAAAEIVVTGTQARVTLTVPTGLVAFAGGGRAGRISGDEIRAHHEDLRRFLAARVRMFARPRGAAAAGRQEGLLTVRSFAGTRVASGPAGLAPATHTTLALLYTWPAPVETLTVRYDLFPPGVSTASCLATILSGDQVHNIAFTPGRREATIGLGRPAVWRSLGGFVLVGIEHILTGYDHMLFLLSLLMVGATLRQRLKIVTAFTAAHSITLSLAVFGLVDLPSRWVESAIALSITYVAAENVWRGRAALGSRWLVTLGFGLVHGLGFASALTELHLPRANLAASLVGFNLGVEIGQIAIILLASLALDAFRQYGWAPVFRRWVSAAAALTGLVWFVQRALLSS